MSGFDSTGSMSGFDATGSMPGSLSAMTEPQAKTFCGDMCRAHGFCCNNPDVGSNQMFSCAQACMVRYYGASQATCDALITAQVGAQPGSGGCSNSFQNHQFSFCSRCDDLSPSCPRGVQGASAGHTGCAMSFDISTGSMSGGHGSMSGFDTTGSMSGFPGDHGSMSGFDNPGSMSGFNDFGSMSGSMSSFSGDHGSMSGFDTTGSMSGFSNSGSMSGSMGGFDDHGSMGSFDDFGFGSMSGGLSM